MDPGAGVWKVARKRNSEVIAVWGIRKQTPYPKWRKEPQAHKTAVNGATERREASKESLACTQTLLSFSFNNRRARE